MMIRAYSRFPAPHNHPLDPPHHMYDEVPQLSMSPHPLSPKTSPLLCIGVLTPPPNMARKQLTLQPILRRSTKANPPQNKLGSVVLRLRRTCGFLRLGESRGSKRSYKEAILPPEKPAASTTMAGAGRYEKEA
eukprot:768130-Hanusia_phi.AAC.4